MAILGVIADDFTGATDIAGMLVKNGMRTIQTIGVPPKGAIPDDVDAVVVALKTRSILPKEAIDPKAALHALPPLIKGYLRVGATFGTGAVVDRQFGTTDVLVVLPISAINPRYIDHFGPTANRHAA